MTSLRRLRPGAAAARRANRPAGLRESLAAVAALRWCGEARATLRVGRERAVVRFDADDTAQVSLAASFDADPQLLLARTASLPTNVRVAGECSARRVLADVHTGDRAACASALAALPEALQRVVAERRPVALAAAGASTSCLDLADRVAPALSALDGRVEVVTLDGAWELRPRVDGAPIPVRMAAVDGGLRIWRDVVSAVPDDVCGHAVAEQALRANERLRFARLELRDGALVAACRLDVRDELDPTALVRAVRAVAVAAHRTAPVLEVLVAHPACSELFVHTFVSTQTEPVTAGDSA